jgi:hypothetical protein
LLAAAFYNHALNPPGKELAAGELVAAFEGLQLETVYLDAAAAERGE